MLSESLSEGRSDRPVHLPHRVLMTTDALGGVWRYAVDTAAGLNARGISVVLAVLGPNPSPAQVEELRGLPETDWVGIAAPLDWLTDDEPALDGLPPILARLVDELCIDLVHLNAPSQAAGLALSCPVVVAAHSCVPSWWRAVRAGPLPDGLAWHLDRNRRGLAAADAVITPSRCHAEALAEVYGTAKPIRVVPNAVLPGTAPAGKQELVFAAARWWDEGKNGRLLDAVARALPWPVEMAGDTEGPNGARIELRHARALGLLPAAAVRSHLARAAIVACPSLYEPFGLTALEAGLARCALVLSDIPTFREIWEDAALFADPRDPSSFAAEIERLIADRALREKLGRAAEERARQFNLDGAIDRLLALYADVSAPSGGDRAAAE